MIKHVSNEKRDLVVVDIIVGLFSPEISGDRIGEIVVGQVDDHITITVRSNGGKYGVATVLDRETALAIGKQLIKVAVNAGEQ